MGVGRHGGYGWKVALAGLLVTVFALSLSFSARAGGTGQVRALHSVKTTEKVVALSFDDGPSPEATPLILEYLKAQKIHATFFLIGQEARAYPHLVAREALEGHDVGNHGMHHKYLGPSLSESIIRDEITQASDAISKAGAPRPTFFRLPGGVTSGRTHKALAETGLQVIGWSVDPRDSFRRPSGEIVKDILAQVKPGSIILLHDGPGERQATYTALRTVVPQLKAQGYRIVSVSELMKLGTAGA